MTSEILWRTSRGQAGEAGQGEAGRGPAGDWRTVVARLEEAARGDGAPPTVTEVVDALVERLSIGDVDGFRTVQGTLGRSLAAAGAFLPSHVAARISLLDQLAAAAPRLPPQVLRALARGAGYDDFVGATNELEELARTQRQLTRAALVPLRQASETLYERYRSALQGRDGYWAKYWVYYFMVGAVAIIIALGVIFDHDTDSFGPSPPSVQVESDLAKSRALDERLSDAHDAARELAAQAVLDGYPEVADAADHLAKEGRSCTQVKLALDELERAGASLPPDVRSAEVLRRVHDLHTSVCP